MSWDGRTALVATTLGDDVLLFYAMTARETLGRPFLYEVELLSTDESLDLSKLLGQPMQVALQLTDFSYREFNGVVTHFSLTGELGRYARYRASLRPWLWLLGQGRNSRVFKNKSVPIIVKEIFREHGFSDFSDALTGEYRTWEYLIQYRESDLNFVSRIMEQEGIYYYFKHADGKHTLVLSDSPSSHEKVKGYEQVPYYPPHHRERRERDHIESWFATRQIRPGTYTSRDFNFKTPGDVMESKSEHPNEHAFAEYEYYDYPGEFRVPSEGNQQARIRLEELQTDHEVVQGAGNARGISVGSIFKLTGFPRDDQNKEYLPTEVNYVVRTSGYESGKVPDEPPDFAVTFSAINSLKQFRAPCITRKPRVEGPQTAIVVGQKGQKNQEIWTDVYGQVDVLFHWDRLNAQAEEASCTVRVAQLWAGSGFGGIHLPRIGQEVIVEFLEGDPDRPIVTGRVYNKDNMPPYTLPDNQTQSGIKSRSSVGGGADNFNEIRFEDKKGQEELHIQAEKNMTTLVKNDQSTTVQANRSASVSGNDSVSVGGDRSLSVSGNLSVSVSGGGKSPIHSSMNVTGKHNLHASDTIDVDAPTHIKFEVGGSSILIEPGKITLTAGGKATLVLDANVFTKSNGGSSILLDANACAKSNGGSTLLLDANVLAESSGKAKVVLDGNAAISATSGDVSIDGMTVAATGKTEASVSVASNSFKASPASSDVAGSMVNVNGNGVVTIGGPVIKIG